MYASQLADKLCKGLFEKGQTIEWMPFQEETISRMVDHPKHVLGLPMGTGKTPTAFEVIHRFGPRRSLLVPTKRAMLSWIITMWKWYPEWLDKYFIIDGSKYGPKQRTDIWNQVATLQKSRNSQFHVMCNWHLLSRDFYEGIVPYNCWDMIVGDEFHKFLRSRNTAPEGKPDRGNLNKTHLALTKLSRGTDAEILVSGSPVSKGAQDLWIPLNLFDPSRFPSYWRFVNTWCYVDANSFGNQVYGTRNVERLKKVISPYYTIKTKKQLGLQKKVRSVWPVEMEYSQHRAYDTLRREMLLEVEGGPPIVCLTNVEKWMKLRKILSCPAIVDKSLGIGGGAMAIKDELLGLPESERHCVIFTPFRDAVMRLAGCDAFGDPALGVPVFKLHGGLSIVELNSRAQAFKKSGGIMLCTIAYAESFDLETCDKAWFLGAEWDPQMNYQAEDRLDRLTNKHGLINIYYVMHTGAITDERQMASLCEKQGAVNLIYNPSRMSKANLKELLK